MSRRVWMAQYLCPNRHAIFATAGEARDRAEAEEKVLGPLREAATSALNGGGFNPWCGICGAKADTWKFELGRTRWRTMEEAKPQIAEEEARQLLTGLIYGTHGPTRPGKA